MPRQTVANPSRHRGGDGHQVGAYADPKQKLRGVKPSGDSALRALKGLATHNGGYGTFETAKDVGDAMEFFHSKKKHKCPFAGCKRNVVAKYVVCFDHWESLPQALRELWLLTPVGHPNRREVYRRVERYAEIRSRFSVLAEQASP